MMKIDRAYIKSRITSLYRNLSRREQLLVWGGAALLLIMILYSSASAVAGIYSEQERKITGLQRNFSSINISLDRYDKLIGRLKNLEKTFRRDGPSGGVRSFLEQALINEAKVPAGSFSIRPGATRTLGENYNQAPFSITFNTTSISDLVAFLRKVTQGESSLLLTKLEVIKGRNAEKLAITIDVSSITSRQK